MTAIAQRHGVTRAAVSKRCVELTEKLGVMPSRAMRSLTARAAYAHARHQRTATILYEYDDVAYAEIAKVQGCSVKAVETRLYRARQKLRERLARCLK